MRDLYAHLGDSLGPDLSDLLSPCSDLDNSAGQDDSCDFQYFYDLGRVY